MHHPPPPPPALCSAGGFRLGTGSKVNHSPTAACIEVCRSCSFLLTELVRSTADATEQRTYALPAVILLTCDSISNVSFLGEMCLGTSWYEPQSIQHLILSTSIV